MKKIINAFVFFIFFSTFALNAENIKILARDPEGHGLLCSSQGKTILMLAGTPEQMGSAHGRLLKKEIAVMLEKIFLVGGAYSVKKSDWFFNRIDEVVKRTSPYIPERFLRECNAMSKAAGISLKNGRSMNFFPEMFHCSGVAIRGKASKNGQILHARVLDYMRDIGIQKCAVLMVFMPDKLNNWLSQSYAGFIGSVTAMNEKGLAIGEMGGRGEGKWDGMPMSFLIREIMEKASNVKEALEIMKKTPRTCEYYYVLSDKSGDLTAVYSNANQEFLVLKPGEQHEKLPEVPEDTVLISGRKRAEHLSKKLKENYGRIGVKEMIEIIKRPVAMNSNLHNAIFAPETLDIWFSDAGKRSLACNEPYAHANLKKLIEFYKKNINKPLK